MPDKDPNRSQAAAVLLERDGRFYCYQPGLSLIASGDTVDSAYKKFADVRDTFFAEVYHAGLTEQVVLAARTAAVTGPPARPVRGAAVSVVGRSVVGELTMFLVKTLMVLLILGGMGIGGGIFVAKTVGPRVLELATGLTTGFTTELKSGAAQVSKQISAATNIQFSIADIAKKAEDVVRDVQALPPERKEALRESIGTLSRALEPIVDAWRNPPPMPDDKTAPTSPPPPNIPGR